MNIYLQKIDYLINIGKGSRKGLAKHCNISQQAVSSMIQRNSTKPETITMIAQYFKVVPDFFLDKDMKYEDARIEKYIKNKDVRAEIEVLKAEMKEVRSLLVKLTNKLVAITF